MDKNKFIILPQIDKYSSRKEWEAACWEEILKSKEVIQLLTTPYERHNLAMRAAAVEKLLSGETYREISKELFLSQQSISLVKKAISEKNYRSYLDRSKKERKKKVYSIDRRPIRRRWPEGRPKRTKYGTIYMPY